MKLIDCLLTPCDLYPEAFKDVPRLTVMGTCVAEHLVNAGASKGVPVAHYLLETWTHVPVPDITNDSSDGIIIHLTLRHILDMAAGIGLGDVAYINTPIDEFGEKAAEIMKTRIDSIAQHFSNTIPLFFLSFIEPPQTTKGFFYNNRADSIYRLVRDLNDQMAQHLTNINGAYYVEVNDILAYFGSGESSDSYHQHFTHAGNFGHKQSDDFYLTILQRIINALETIKANSPIKLIITDLDNTLWKGIPAEEDEIIPWEHMEGWPIGYVEALLECKRRGILLAISSKNNEFETIENFRKIWGLKIQPEDFFSYKINWSPKSSNIKDIIQEANILPGNVLFIDDNPLEIEEVKRAIPEIRVLTLPEKRWRNVLLYAPQTQLTTLSVESQNRTNLLRAKIERDKLSEAMDRDAYLQSLDLRIGIKKIRESKDPSFARAFELLNKTNQFNTTGKRWSDAEISNFFQNDSGIIYAANVEDRLANHGLTALAVVSGSTILQFVLSCRVFGLGVETALLNNVMKDLHDAQHITGLLNETGRNTSCLNFYSRHNFIFERIDDEERQVWQSVDIPEVPAWIALKIASL